MICPHCQQEIPDTDIARHLAAKGGRKSKGNLDPEKAREMAKARWAKARKERDQ